ncbi:hypothetical protein CVT24_007319, partial [Panaeolus cyanescens]
MPPRKQRKLIAVPDATPVTFTDPGGGSHSYVLMQEVEQNKHWVICDLCSDEIPAQHGSSKRIAAHRDSPQCGYKSGARRKRLEQGFVQRAAHAAIEEHFGPSSADRDVKVARTLSQTAATGSTTVFEPVSQIDTCFESDSAAPLLDKTIAAHHDPTLAHASTPSKSMLLPISRAASPALLTPTTPQTPRLNLGVFDTPHASRIIPFNTQHWLQSLQLEGHNESPTSSNDEPFLHSPTLPDNSQWPAHNPSTISTSSDDDVYINLPDSESDCCMGLLVDWAHVGSLADTYNFQSHDGNQLPWKIVAFISNKSIRIQLSPGCNVYLKSEVELKTKTCHKCYQLSHHPKLTLMLERAMNPEPSRYTNYSYLTNRQKDMALERYRLTLNKWKLKALNSNRTIIRQNRIIQEQDQVIIAMSQNRTASAGRVLATSLRRGHSSSVILQRLLDCRNGKLVSREPWTEFELARANLARFKGGSQLLYSLSKAEGYPSARTLQRLSPCPEITPSIGQPNDAEFDTNISTFLGPKGRKSSSNTLIGQALLIDDVAIEEAPRFDDNRSAFLGLCREHSGRIKTKIDTIEDLKAIHTALQAPKDDPAAVHYGKDATVVALAPLTAQDHYYPVPMAISASCKRETAGGFRAWIDTLIQRYNNHQYGAKLHGRIYAIYTDGASLFRKFRMQYCLTTKIPQDSLTGRLLHSLPGLNCYTGENLLLGSCDPKHIFKRFATSLRSATGFMVYTTMINPSHVLEALTVIGGMTIEKAKLMLNPSDKQNVPVAVNLIQNLVHLKMNPRLTSVDVAPQVQARTKCVIFIATVFSFFITPFLDVEMSLSQQIQSLSTYAHLITGMHHINGLNFMSGALLADSQAIVKCIIITAARLQACDPTSEYFILFEGDDRLENLFSIVRTLDHNPNFDILQLAHKISMATEMERIYEYFPRLHPGHQRRQFKANLAGKGNDRTNPKSWIGDVIVGNVDIRQEYLAGRDAALRIMKEYLGPSIDLDINFSQIFSVPEVDHLRPQGSYIGTRKEDVDHDDIDPVLAHSNDNL